MKKNRLCAALLAAVCVVLLTVPAFAAVDASDQIITYSMDVTPESGRLKVYFSICGKGIVNKVGAEWILVSKSVDGTLVDVYELFEDDPGMSDTNTASHGNILYFDSTAGVSYTVVVSVFAENSEGRDARMEIFSVTGR